MKMISHICLVLSLAAPLCAGPSQSGILKAQAGLWVDAQGKEVRLRGIGLGNWLLPEGYMWHFGGQGDRPRRIEKVVETVMGKAEAQAFWKEFRDQFITQADIQRIAALGFNSVRPALNARDFVTEGSNPQFIEEGFQRMDALIRWCRASDLYVILDLHGAPGGQTGKNIDDSPNDHPDLFRLRSNQDLTVEIWKRIATRYKDEPVVAGYDLLNEPLPDEFKQYKDKLEPLYRRITREIRKIDTRHAIIVEGSNWANDWSVFNRPFDPNMVYQYHKYWNEPDKPSIQGYLDFQARWQVPVYVGEFGESKVGEHWYWAATQLFDDLGHHWSYWTWKRLDAGSPIYSIKRPAGWEKIVAVSEGKPGPSLAEGRKIMAEFLKNIRLENCTQNTGVVNALFHRLPYRIEAEDFGSLGQGKSYSSTDKRRRAERYRRGEGLAIESLAGVSGYNVGWIEGGEWLEFDATLPPGPATLRLRVACDGKGSDLHLERAGQDISGKVAIPGTGGWNKWKVVEKTIQVPAGSGRLRLVFDTGGHNLDWLEVVPQGKPAVRLEAEAYVGYSDKDPENKGTALRKDGVDVQALEEDAALCLGLQPGEWVRYEVNSPVAKGYALRIRAESKGGAQARVLVGSTVVASPSLNSGWQELSLGTVQVPAGKHYLTVQADKGSLRLDWVELAAR